MSLHVENEAFHVLSSRNPSLPALYFASHIVPFSNIGPTNSLLWCHLISGAGAA